MTSRFIQIPWDNSTQSKNGRVVDVQGHRVFAENNKDSTAVEASLDDGPKYAFDARPDWIDDKENILVSPNRTFSVATMFMDEVDKKLKKLNKVAAKIDLPPVRLHVLRTFNRKYKNTELEHADNLVQFKEIYLEGDAPRVDGHTFLAKVEHGKNGNLIDVAPGVEMDLSTMRNADNLCNHCGTRRERKETFLLATPDEKIMQVGRNCLADFLRGANPTNIVAFWRELDAFGELEDRDPSGGGGGREHIGFEPLDVLAYASRAIKLHGWVSKTASEDYNKTSTAHYVRYAIEPFRPNKMDSASERAAALKEWEDLQPLEADFEIANAALAWLMSQPGSSEYIYKLQVLVQDNFIPAKRVSLFVSAVSGYLREMDLLKKKEREAEATLNEPFGVVGTRYDLELEVVRVRVIDGSYGDTTIIALRDKDGRQFTWFASGNKSQEFEEGMFVSGKATIKKHDKYNGISQTHITRAKFEEIA